MRLTPVRTSASAPHGRRSHWFATAIFVSTCFITGCRSQPDAQPLTEKQALAEIARLALADDRVNDPAQLCPPDAGIYVRLDGLADWRATEQDDPLAGYVWKQLRQIQQPEIWKRAEQSLDLDTDALFDRYFGTTLAVVAERGSLESPLVVISRVEREHLLALPDALGLKPQPPTEAVRALRTYLTKDEDYLFALSGRWLIVADRDYEPFFDATLAVADQRLRALDHGAAAGNGAAEADTLADDADFVRLTTRLPDDRSPLIFIRNKRKTHHHALTLTTAGLDADVHYIAEIPKFDEFVRDYVRGEQVDFGPLPDSTISAFTLNLAASKAPPGTNFLDWFVFPRSFGKDVVPQVSGPVVLFLGQVSRQDIEPDPGMDVPALGIAIKLENPDVAADLHRIMNGLRMIVTLGHLDLRRSFFGVRHAEYQGVEYQVADFGQTLIQHVDDPEMTRLVKLPSSAGLTKLTFGRVGQWYVICSQEAFFKRCVEAHEAPTRRFTYTQQYHDFNLQPRPGLIATGLTRAPQLSALMTQVAEYWKSAEAAAEADARSKPRPPDRERTAREKVEQPLKWIANSIEHRHSFWVQLWHDIDGSLRAKLHIERKNEP